MDAPRRSHAGGAPRRRSCRCNRRGRRARARWPAYRAAGRRLRAAPRRRATRACEAHACALRDPRSAAAPRPRASCPCGIILYAIRQGTRRARVELPAADPAHEESARRPAFRAGAQSARHRSGRGQGFPGVLEADRAPARLAQRSEPRIHLLHEKEVKRVVLTAALCSFSGFVNAADATFTVKVLTPETALKAAQAALKKCRDSGYQATVAVVDRMGVVQVLLRDRFAGPNTPDMAAAKAYTAASFRTNTTE